MSNSSERSHDFFFPPIPEQCTGCFSGKNSTLLSKKTSLHTEAHYLIQPNTWWYFIRLLCHFAATAQIPGQDGSSQTVWVQYSGNSLPYSMGRKKQFLRAFSHLNCYLSYQWRAQRNKWDLTPYFSVEACKTHCLKYVDCWLPVTCARTLACA